jgi:hypothetical protein
MRKTKAFDLLLLFSSPGVHACGNGAKISFPFPFSLLQGARMVDFEPIRQSSPPEGGFKENEIS